MSDSDFHDTPEDGMDLGPTVTVIIPAYTLDRWELIKRAVESVGTQSRPAIQLVLCIDHNDALVKRCLDEWADATFPSGLKVEVIADESVDDFEGREEHARVHGSQRRFGAGSVRNTALRHSRGEIVAFLDDDAEAQVDWLEKLVIPYQSPDVVAVGGAPIPRYETARPDWFPGEFDWVFGCAYEGMPTSVAPLRHLIGANMSARRVELSSVGGFQSVDFDDMDMCHRLADAYPSSRIMYTPEAVVFHFVSADRVTWNYFWRRCFFVNREKVRAFHDMGEAANLASERDFVVRILSRQLFGHLQAFFTGDLAAGKRLAASLTGVVLAGLGNLAGQWRLRRSSPR